MGPLDAIKTGFARSFQFRGRATRSEFWWFATFFFGGSFLIFWLFELVSNGHGLQSAFAMLAFQACFIMPFLSVLSRRAHDFGYHGFFPMIPFVVLVLGILLSLIEAQVFPSELPGTFGAIIAYGGFLLAGVPVLLWFLLPGQRRRNRFGPNPHEVPS